ncbi:MAG: serine/threonine protein kinase [Labilithrix sp.]|nr:serine/threonine protein kinase [Labilithrix sp.]
MPVIEGAFRHAALARFSPLQSLASEGGPEIVLARTKGKNLVVVKVLLDRPIPPEVASELSHETSLGARLTHDAIVQTRAMVLEDEVAALVTEFLPGVSLQRLLRFATQRGVRLPDDAGWYVVERVLSALAFAHSQRDHAGASAPILHRSVGPGSVVVGWDGSTKLGDFGWTRLRSIIAPLGHVSITEHGTASALMAPEQARGGAVTERADVFCAALLALRVATGRTPYARFRDTASGVLLAMSEGKVLPLSKTRPELPAGVRAAFDRALAPDPQARTVTAQELADAVRAGFDLAKGKAALVKLLERWREQLEKSMTPWEKRASMHDGVVETSELREGALALATADDRPSSDALVTTDQPDEPWKKDKDALPNAEAPLAPTDAGESLSRVGAAAESAMSIPLPAMRMTMPSVPVYGPHIGPPPAPVAKPFFTGKVAAFVMFAVFVLLVVAAVFLLKWLSGPS